MLVLCGPGWLSTRPRHSSGSFPRQGHRDMQVGAVPRRQASIGICMLAAKLASYRSVAPQGVTRSHADVRSASSALSVLLEQLLS